MTLVDVKVTFEIHETLTTAGNYNIKTAISGLSLDSSNRLVYTRPAKASAGTATIIVNDGFGQEAEMTISIGQVESKIGGNSTLALWIVIIILVAGGSSAAVVVLKRKRSRQAK